jgi:hypothetical protein
MLNGMDRRREHCRTAQAALNESGAAAYISAGG